MNLAPPRPPQPPRRARRRVRARHAVARAPGGIWLLSRVETRRLARRCATGSSALRRLGAAMPPVNPPPRVWNGIVGRLGLIASPDREAPWWSKLRLWRGFALASTVAAVALGVALVAGRIEPDRTEPRRRARRSGRSPGADRHRGARRAGADGQGRRPGTGGGRPRARVVDAARRRARPARLACSRRPAPDDSRCPRRARKRSRHSPSASSPRAGRRRARRPGRCSRAARLKESSEADEKGVRTFSA